ncbi:hypothetical protein GCM10027562_37570 [Arthrobacter pigmenti]
MLPAADPNADIGSTPGGSLPQPEMPSTYILSMLSNGVTRGSARLTRMSPERTAFGPLHGLPGPAFYRLPAFNPLGQPKIAPHEDRQTEPPPDKGGRAMSDE